MKLWQHKHSSISKQERERRWRQTHKEVARQLAPYLSDVHEKPPLADTFDFLDTVQALDVPFVHFVTPSYGGMSSSGSCVSISCSLPSVGGRRQTKEERGNDARTQGAIEDHGRCNVGVGPNHAQNGQQDPEEASKEIHEAHNNAVCERLDQREGIDNERYSYSLTLHGFFFSYNRIVRCPMRQYGLIIAMW